MLSELTDRRTAALSLHLLEGHCGYRDKGPAPEVPVLEMQPDPQLPHGKESLLSPQSPAVSWDDSRSFQTLPLWGGETGWRTDEPPHLSTTTLILAFFCFSLGIGTLCSEVCTKQNCSRDKWKSSRLFLRCTAPFVRAADLGEGAQDIMPASLGKHTQTIVCV